MSEPIRLQKYLSSQGVCSRRNAEDFIRKGLITINGNTATLGDRVTGEETIILHGKEIKHTTPERKILAWNKPIGVEVTLSAARDKGYKTLLDFDFGPTRVFPIGRLDKDSRGLLILTNDGDLANNLMHPRYEKEKEYIVTVQKVRRTKDDEIKSLAKKMSKGLLVDHKMTNPCRVEVMDDQTLRFTLKEGRNRQIRKMCEVVGLEVVDLLRIRFGNILLEDLAEGDIKKIKDISLGN